MGSPGSCAPKSCAHFASTATKGRENGPKLLQNIAEMDRQPPSATYKFGPFALDIEAGMLLRGVEPTLLGQRAIALLRLLLDRAGSPVSKDALIEAAWPGLAVEDSNLTVQIAALRRAVDQEGGSVRRAGEGDDREYELKPLVAIQWVRLPRDQGQPASRKRALHVCGNATREAYGSGCQSCVLAPKSHCRSLRRPPSGGNIDVTETGEGTLVRPGSWSGAEAQEGSSEDLRDPICVHV